MFFSERLNFLMNQTHASNASLAKAVALDPSYISRLRSGSRTPYREAGYLKAMAGFFFKKLTEDYQIAALEKVMEPRGRLAAEGMSADLLYDWLTENMAEAADRPPNDCAGEKRPEADPPESAVDPASYYGIAGKRNAVLRLLESVLEKKSPQTLYLYSDEETSWLSDDPGFTAQWASGLKEIIRRGNKIVIIHFVDRALHEMIPAIGQWLPLYLTGAIEPYYYPRIRDGIFRRTLFLVPGCCGLAAASVGEDTEGMLNLFVTDKRQIAALLSEYENYLALCRPLMTIYDHSKASLAAGAFFEIGTGAGDVMLFSPSLSSLTMPETLLKRMLKRTGAQDRAKVLAEHQAASRLFHQRMSSHPTTEFINLPPLEAFAEGEVKAHLPLTPGGSIAYTAAEYREHLAAVLRLMDSTPQYRVILGSTLRLGQLCLAVNETEGIYLESASPPPVSLATRESSLVAAFWEYMLSKLRSLPAENVERDSVARKLRAYLELLEDEGTKPQ